MLHFFFLSSYILWDICNLPVFVTNLSSYFAFFFFPFLEIFGNLPGMCNTIIRYVKSRSDKQLRSRASEDVTSDCKPEAVTASNSPIVPCGLIAWSLFNDTYGFSVKNKVLEVSKRNIAWKSDQEHKFGSDVYPKNFQSGSLIGGAKLNASIPVICLSLLPSLLHLSMFLPPSTFPMALFFLSF